MSEDNYQFQRPTHGYGTRFCLRLGERFEALTEGGEEQFGQYSPPPNPPNSPSRAGTQSVGPSSPTQLGDNPPQSGTVHTTITPSDQVVNLFLRLTGTNLLAAKLFEARRSLQFNPLPQQPTR